MNMKNKGMIGNGQLSILVIKNGQFVKLLRNRSLYPRVGWYAAKYKGEYFPVFWNAIGEHCIEIGNGEWMGVSSTPIKEYQKLAYYRATAPQHVKGRP